MNQSSTGKRKRNKPTKVATPQQQQAPPPSPPEEDKPFDYGGIPSRDLKKNLGCG